MKKDSEKSDSPKKVFDFFVGCAQIVSTIVGVIALIISFIALIWAVRNPTAVPLIIRVISGESTPTPLVITLPTGTSFPTYTPPPTYTPFPTFPPTETPIPTSTATLFAPPADGILYQDDFALGLAQDWKAYSGTWLVSNGRLTKLTVPHGNDYEWISLDKPEWKNYILSVDISKMWTDSVVVAVRNSTSKTNLLGLKISRGDNVDLAFISSNWVDDVLVAGGTGVEIQPTQEYNYQIEVQGDNYILRLNGREIQRVSMSGYDSGGVTFGVNCYDDNYGCTTFDNIKVTYLP